MLIITTTAALTHGMVAIRLYLDNPRQQACRAKYIYRTAENI